MASSSGGEIKVTEGLATLYFPSDKGVFYNPPQIPNRDLSVLVLRQFAEDWQKEAAEKQLQRLEKARRAEAYRSAKQVSSDSVSAAVESNPAAVAAVVAPEAAGTGVQAGGDAAVSSQKQEASRDLSSVAAPEGGADTLIEPATNVRLRVLDALSASGLRAMRYAKEVAGLTQVVANDVDPVAVDVMTRNFERNGLSEPLVVPHVGDAARYLHDCRPPHGERFEVIDLDPYGSAAPFLDSAVQAVAEGGLLMVTCTDLAVLCGSYPEACSAKYGSFPIKGKYCHEAALRIVLNCIDTHANRYGRYITPLLAVHINFYVRVFVRVYSSKSIVKLSPSKKAYLYQCSGCNAYALQPVARHFQQGNSSKIVAGTGPPVGEHCVHCGRVHHVGGPLWAAPMQDDAFVRRLCARLDKGETFDSQRRLTGMLSSVLEELPDVPLFTQLAALCATLHIGCPPTVAVMSALMRQGYRVSRSHTDPIAIKTDASFEALFDVLRCWAAEKEDKRGKGGNVDLSETSPGHAILSKVPAVQADFRPLPQVQQLLSKKGADGEKVGKFLPNPAEWGPGSRGTSHTSLNSFSADLAEKAAAARGPDAKTADGGHDEFSAVAADASASGTVRAGELGQQQRDKRARNQGRKRGRKRELAQPYVRPGEQRARTDSGGAVDVAGGAKDEPENATDDVAVDDASGKAQPIHTTDEATPSA
uniref:tRNA (guanine(26)-N(2))-dimethyltransferase n=1 Tax=Coccolithus braarudii TaxID=221442 RepID=A0A7S0LH64_9EUKA|eukprot:CAMPEP_0183345016 /NCGR_PEP_ID=MMETSP0164_2-20130417/10557_1 /TAXON_ID=221442 /ORGANISM="Coccolithus pelagicus ssp braarudi, Strain PLY182g" /LENGTH=701 /DNA_ID=CAMNT_0025516109 /DNA_START=30 /DNA_END=2135 /DNA_ORIENTATION=+